jgi:hypothetical protein
MPFWYFLKVPELPAKVAHQSKLADVRQYLLSEGDSVEPGTPIILFF